MYIDPLVSVIVPIYKVEEFIKKTVESIMNQDYKNLEIILVNDGSPDKSPQIIDDLSKRDKRIYVIHQENKGVSAARNAGIKIARGEYITFVDGDDWIEPNYISYFINLVTCSDCEMVMNRSNYLDNKKYKSKNNSYIISAEKAIEWIYLGKIFVAVWNKMYKTSFLKENGIVFDESIWYGEGMLFNIDCLQYSKKVVIGEKNVYHQVSNPDSAMRKFNLQSNYCGIKSLEIQKDHWRKKNRRIEKAWDYHRARFNWSIMNGLIESDMDNEYREVFNECIKNIRKKIFVFLKVDIPIKEKMRYLICAIAPSFMVNRIKKRIKDKS